MRDENKWIKCMSRVNAAERRFLKRLVKQRRPWNAGERRIWIRMRTAYARCERKVGLEARKGS